MTIKSGPPPSLSMQEIANEFGGSWPLYLSQFYRGGSRVPNIPQNYAVSTGGGISIGMFYNTVQYVPVGVLQLIDDPNPGTSDYYAPAHTTNVILHIQGAGGGGSGGGGDGRSSGGDFGCCGYPGAYGAWQLNILPGDLVRCVVGAGGAGGLGVYAGANSMNPAAYGLAGEATYVYIYRNGNLIWQAGLGGGQAQGADSCGDGTNPCFGPVCGYGYDAYSNSGIGPVLGYGNTHGGYGSVVVVGSYPIYDEYNNYLGEQLIYGGVAGPPGVAGGGGGGGIGARAGALGPGSRGGHGHVRVIFRDS